MIGRWFLPPFCRRIWRDYGWSRVIMHAEDNQGSDHKFLVSTTASDYDIVTPTIYTSVTSFPTAVSVLCLTTTVFFHHYSYSCTAYTILTALFPAFINMSLFCVHRLVNTSSFYTMIVMYLSRCLSTNAALVTLSISTSAIYNCCPHQLWLMTDTIVFDPVIFQKSDSCRIHYHFVTDFWSPWNSPDTKKKFGERKYFTVSMFLLTPCHNGKTCSCP